VKRFIDPPAAVRPLEDLAELLAAAKGEHEAGLTAERASLEHYRKAGQALLRAKAAAGHGRWLPALAKTSIPQQRASEYMRLAAGWDKLPPGGSFGLKEALGLIEGEHTTGDGESLDELARRVNDAHDRCCAAHDLCCARWAITLRHFHRLGLLIRDARSDLNDQDFAELLRLAGVDEVDARDAMRAAGRRGDNWEPALKDGEEVFDRYVRYLLRQARIDPEADNDEDTA
jgi:hypothetical protein